MGMYAVLGMLFLFLVHREIEHGPAREQCTWPGGRMMETLGSASSPLHDRGTWCWTASISARESFIWSWRVPMRSASSVLRSDRSCMGRQRSVAAGRRAARCTSHSPALYASAFSGFYLPLMMVLWLLMLRGIAIEFRSHIDSPCGSHSGI